MDGKYSPPFIVCEWERHCLCGTAAADRLMVQSPDDTRVNIER